MRNNKKMWIGLLCVVMGFAGVLLHQGYSASIQAGTKKQTTKVRKKPSATYAPLKEATMVVRSRVYVKKIKNVKKEIKGINIALRQNKKEIKKLKKHKTEAKNILVQGEDEINDDLKNYTEKYNASEYNNNVGYSLYADLQDDYVTQEETVLGNSLQSLALSMGDEAVSDSLEEDVENVSTRLDLLRGTVKEQKKELKALKKRKKRVEKYVNIVFDSKDIFLPSNVDKKSLEFALAGTELESLAGVFIQAEEKYGVNAIALAGIAAHESAWGSSRRARYHNNLTGFGVYSNSAKGINGKTKKANILGTAKCLATRYAEPGQSYYHGTSLLGVNQSYAASKTWASRVETCGITIMNKIAQYNN